ncbi:MAG: ribbon-helix-helix protein, CopG family [Actinobacteria bacterium]|nr:ribbon-helix-helix protein, CopG family [Actinomycetota bacterium]
MALEGYKTVTVSEETYDRLEKHRAEQGLRSLREAIEQLLQKPRQ